MKQGREIIPESGGAIISEQWGGFIGIGTVEEPKAGNKAIHATAIWSDPRPSMSVGYIGCTDSHMITADHSPS